METYEVTVVTFDCVRQKTITMCSFIMLSSGFVNSMMPFIIESWHVIKICWGILNVMQTKLFFLNMVNVIAVFLKS